MPPKKKEPSSGKLKREAKKAAKAAEQAQNAQVGQDQNSTGASSTATAGTAGTAAPDSGQAVPQPPPAGPPPQVSPAQTPPAVVQPQGMKLRIMTWNIEEFGRARPNQEQGERCHCLAEVIRFAEADIIVIEELMADSSPKETMECLRVSLGDERYLYAISEITGTEHYGFLFNHHVASPLSLDATCSKGTMSQPVRNLNEKGVQFNVWDPHQAGNAGCRIPLVDLYLCGKDINKNDLSVNSYEDRRDRGLINAGGMHRLPCLAMFRIGGQGGPILSLIANHCKAPKSESLDDGLSALDQISKLGGLHISQKYKGRQGASGGIAVTVNGEEWDVSENIVFLGDFNHDFLSEGLWKYSYGYLTGIGLSGTRPANRPSPLGLTASPLLDLQVAVTDRGTVLREPRWASDIFNSPANPQDKREWNKFTDACFDNLLFGGARLRAIPQGFPVDGGPQDLGVIIPIPFLLDKADFLDPSSVPFSDAWFDFLGAEKHWSRGWCDRRRIKAVNRLSDHLPVMLELEIDTSGATQAAHVQPAAQSSTT